MIPSINVMMWGRKVGSLVEVGTGRNRKICFYFDPSYVRGGLDIAPACAFKRYRRAEGFTDLSG